MTTPRYTVTPLQHGYMLSCYGGDGKLIQHSVISSGRDGRDHLDAVEDGEAFLARQRATDATNGANPATSEEGQADGDQLAGVGPAITTAQELTREDVQMIKEAICASVTASSGGGSNYRSLVALADDLLDAFKKVSASRQPSRS